jgi:Ca-activated chloride channel homolog
MKIPTTRNRLIGRRKVLLLGLSGIALRPAADRASQATFSTDVDLVLLNVSVTENGKTAVLGLQKNNFRVYEDGVPQNISYFRNEDIPVTVGLVVDRSGSMVRKRSEVISAAAAFAKSCNPQDQMFVVNFNENVAMGLPQGTAFTNSTLELTQALSRFAARGRTALYDAVAMGLRQLTQSDLRKKVLIVVSDGGDNSSAITKQQILKMAEESDATIYTVGLYDEYDTDRNPSLLKQLAKVSGGEALFPKEVKDTTLVLKTVSKDIRNQYTVGYAPKNQKWDKRFRQIRVLVVAPHSRHWKVRTRKGYIAAAAIAGSQSGEMGKQ